MREKDEAGSALGAPRQGALAALLLLVGCLNPRPEDLPSSADPSQPNAELGDPGGAADDSARAGSPGGADEINAAGAAPADEDADDPRPAFAPPAPAPEGAPPEPADAGPDATTEPAPDAG